MIEYKIPKDEDRLEKYWKMSADALATFPKFVKDGKITEFTYWSDNSGTMFTFFHFDSADQFAKFWGDMDLQRQMSELALLLDDAKVRLLRPGIMLRE
jgi:hypothetical protein